MRTRFLNCQLNRNVKVWIILIVSTLGYLSMQRLGLATFGFQRVHLDMVEHSRNYTRAEIENMFLEAREKGQVTELPGARSDACAIDILHEECNCVQTIYPNLGASCSRMTVAQYITQIVASSGRESYCSDLSSLRGKNQMVVSFSLFGDPMSAYWEGLLKLAPDVEDKYPGWLLRVYLDGTTGHNIFQLAWTCKLLCGHQNADICPVERLHGMGNVRNVAAAVWRFAVIQDPTVSRYIVRDSDSKIIQREVDAVREWIRSGKCYHVMRDHPGHGVPMLGGMWGGCLDLNSKEVAKAREKIFMITSNKRGLDQFALRTYLYPAIQGQVLEHDAFYCKRFKNSVPFPSQRDPSGDFIGARAYRQEYRNEKINKKCPVECRPAKHPEWEYC
ncbi:uncharacterized protein LOC143019810 [Oratosquilla oratoria]|uniref:uncharacterized protein LOC143019810 n=1 Tax=Oratosquilla oratoria TaxID=337810 RepID=UPI003F75F542